MIDNEISNTRMVENGVLANWMEFALKNATQDIRNPNEVRQLALALLSNIWIRFPAKIEENQSNVEFIVSLLRRGTKNIEKN